MFELTISDAVYEFNFDMGFLREINARIKTPIDGLKGVEKNMGLQYMIASVIDGDPEALVDVLDAANKGSKPRVTRNLLDAYISDENTDIDALFEDVLGFLEKANVTKKVMKTLKTAMKLAEKN